MYHLRTLYAQSFRITLAPFVLPRLLARRFAGASSLANVIILTNERTLQPIKVYKINLFCCPHSRSITGSSFRSLSKIPHCWLKSLDLVSVPVWLIILSNQLRIKGFVSRYLTNNLILQKLIL